MPIVIQQIDIVSRKKYINAYQNVIDYDEEGREKHSLVYLGEYFEVDLDQEGLRRFRLTQVFLFVAVLLIHIGLGFLNHAGGRVLYVAVPYAIAFFPLLYWAFGVFRMPSKKQEFRQEHIGLSFDRVKNMSLTTAIAAGITALGMLIFIILFRNTSVWIELLFLLGEIIVLCLAIYAHVLSKKLKITKIEKPQS